MEEERGNVEVTTKVTEPLLTVPNPRAFQQNVVPATPGQSKSTMFHTLYTFDTEYCADSVEWCPAPDFRDIFVCGTYQLADNEKAALTSKCTTSSKRLGRIYLFRVLKDGQLHLLQQLEVPGVLDMKWAHIVHQNHILLGVVNSIGNLQLYQLETEDNVTLKLLTEIKMHTSEDECLALSLDWCSGKWESPVEENLKIAVSDSKGSMTLIEVREDSLEKINQWQAHDFEAWVSAFDYWNTNIIYTGGDDCKFQRFDTRIEYATAVNRSHGAGVTSIHSNISKEYLLASGSYDEILRLWDTRNFIRPISETNLRGGIWRLKWDPFTQRYLFAACMYGGFRVIDCRNTDSPTVISEYNEHESISYGCDWCYLNPQEIKNREIFTSDAYRNILFGTCSFYDHILNLSALSLQEN